MSFFQLVFFDDLEPLDTFSSFYNLASFKTCFFVAYVFSIGIQFYQIDGPFGGPII